MTAQGADAILTNMETQEDVFFLERREGESNLRRSATEAQLGLEFGSVSKMEFGFRCQIQLRFQF